MAQTKTRRSAVSPPSTVARTQVSNAGAAGLPRFLHRKATDGPAGIRQPQADNSAADRGHVPRYLHADIAVSQPGDAQEREADRVAAQVMRLPQATAPRPSAAAGEPGTVIPRKAAAATAAPNASAATVTLSPPGSGRPLDSATRDYFEARFGSRFDHVRTHTDTSAAQWSRALGARAFAQGADIYFAAGQAPRKDALTAHELAHVVQQQDAQVANVIQRAPDAAAGDAATADTGAAQTGTAVLIREAMQAIGTDGESAGFHYLPAELEGDAVFVLFDNLHVQRLFRHLLREWLGATGTVESLENTIAPAAPQWVGAFRAKALNLRKAGAHDPGYAEQQQLAELALRLADSVEAETVAQRVRRRFVEEVDRRIGTTVMSQQAIDAERAKPATPGLTPSNFTTCIVFFGQVMGAVMQQFGSNVPLLKGPNYYKEINPVNGEGHLPPGAWHPCTPGERPKPGDLLIFSFTKNEVLDNKTQVYKDGFAHITIMRAVEPLRDAPADLAADGYTEKFITVDGGGTTATETVRYFAPEACLIKGPGTIVRKLRGWIDVETAAQARLGTRTPVQG